MMWWLRRRDWKVKLSELACVVFGHRWVWHTHHTLDVIADFQLRAVVVAGGAATEKTLVLDDFTATYYRCTRCGLVDSKSIKASVVCTTDDKEEATHCG
jgi:hypothetical protein